VTGAGRHLQRIVRLLGWDDELPGVMAPSVSAYGRLTAGDG
jgi:hypothetical protein